MLVVQDVCIGPGIQTYLPTVQCRAVTDLLQHQGHVPLTFSLTILSAFPQSHLVTSILCTSFWPLRANPDSASSWSAVATCELHGLASVDFKQRFWIPSKSRLTIGKSHARFLWFWRTGNSDFWEQFRESLPAAADSYSFLEAFTILLVLYLEKMFVLWTQSVQEVE